MRWASSRALAAWSSPPGWRPSAPSSSPRCTPATCSWRPPTPTRGSGPSPRDVLEPNGVEVRLVPTDDDAVREALPGATLVWLESPSNPGLVVLDLPALIAEAHAGGRHRGRRQHARRPAAPAPARARRRLLGHERLQVPRRPQRPHHGRRRGRRRRARRGAARVADRHGLDPGPVRGLAGAPLAGHAGAAPRAPGGQRAGARRRRCARATTSPACAGPASARSSASTWARRPAPTPSWRPASWWRRPRASAACTPTPSAARAGAATTSARASSASTPGSRTRPTCVADVERALELSRP